MDEREFGILIGKVEAIQQQQTTMASDVKEMKNSLVSRVGKVEKDIGELHTGIKIIKWVAATPAALTAIGVAIMAILKH